MRFPKPQLLLIVLILIIGSIWYLESKKVDTGAATDENTEIMVTRMTPDEKKQMYEVAHEISSPDAFINTDGITIEEEIEKGNVVLVDFWTYSCINCQRTLPYLNAWQDKYADQGLTIIGIHTPEFEFEKELANVQRAVEEYDIQYPVVLDNDYSTWRAYGNRYWPRKYLIDIDGFIVYDHIGEGGYEETEAKIVELLKERKERLGLEGEIESGATPEGVDVVDESRPRTPEIYFGYDRLGTIANLPSKDCFDVTCTFSFPMTLSLNGFALSGDWHIGPEEAKLESDTGAIRLRFVANKVNIVARGGDSPVHAEIFLDGEPLSEAVSGLDVVDGEVTIGEAGLYNLVDLKGKYGEHTLEIRAKEAGLSAFTFTFG